MELPKFPPGKLEEKPEEVVGVTRPPPTAELKPIRDGFPLPGAKELCDDVIAARDSCARDEPDRFKFCKEPIPAKKVRVVFSRYFRGIFEVFSRYFRDVFQIF